MCILYPDERVNRTNLRSFSLTLSFFLCKDRETGHAHACTRARDTYEINSVYAREQDESEALSSLVWALGACKGMMQSRSGAVRLKATIHHCRTRQGRNSLIHRYTLFLPCALRSSLSRSLSRFLPSLVFLQSISPSLPLTLYFSLFFPSFFLSLSYICIYIYVYMILRSDFFVPFLPILEVKRGGKSTILLPLDTAST